MDTKPDYWYQHASDEIWFLPFPPKNAPFGTTNTMLNINYKVRRLNDDTALYKARLSTKPGDITITYHVEFISKLISLTNNRDLVNFHLRTDLLEYFITQLFTIEDANICGLNKNGKWEKLFKPEGNPHNLPHFPARYMYGLSGKIAFLGVDDYAHFNEQEYISDTNFDHLPGNQLNYEYEDFRESSLRHMPPRITELGGLFYSNKPFEVGMHHSALPRSGTLLEAATIHEDYKYIFKIFNSVW